MAVLVIIPAMEAIHLQAQSMHNSDGKPVTELAGKIVGRIPRHLSCILCGGITHGWLHKVQCIFTGQLIHGGPVQGGGPQLTCAYILDIMAEDQQRHIAAFTSYLRRHNFVDRNNLFI